MMHFKKNLLAEYKVHGGSDESSSPPSSPSSSASSFAYDQHEVEAPGSNRKETLRVRIDTLDFSSFLRHILLNIWRIYASN